MARKKQRSSSPAQTNARRARWELSKAIRLLTSPPTEAEGTRERLARIAAEVRSLGGSFDARLAAMYVLLDERPCDPQRPSGATLGVWVRSHVASLDAARRTRGGIIETEHGQLPQADYYPVPGDVKDSASGVYALVPDHELPALD